MIGTEDWPPAAWYEHHAECRERFQLGRTYRVGDRIIFHTLATVTDQDGRLAGLERVQVPGVVRSVHAETHGYGIQLDTGRVCIVLVSQLDPDESAQPALFDSWP